MLHGYQIANLNILPQNMGREVYQFQHTPYKEFCVENSKISWCYLAVCGTVFKLVKHVC